MSPSSGSRPQQRVQPLPVERRPRIGLALGRDVTNGEVQPGGALGPEFVEFLGGPIRNVYGYSGGSSEILAAFVLGELYGSSRCADYDVPRLYPQWLTEQRIAPVVILTAFSQRDLVERARDAGAMAYLVKPFNKNDLVPAIEMAVSRFAELQLLEAEVADLTERLETRKLVDRAKGVLQQQLELSEPESFRWIQKTAMDLRLSMRQVAEGVIAHGPGIAGGESE